MYGPCGSVMGSAHGTESLENSESSIPAKWINTTYCCIPSKLWVTYNCCTIGSATISVRDWNKIGMQAEDKPVVCLDTYLHVPYYGTIGH